MAPPWTSDSLSVWLEWLETVHPVTVDLGLERVRAVALRLELIPAERPVILVGGTNGKGSTVAFLESVYQAGGYLTGAYTSPHIIDFCERIRVGGVQVTPLVVVNALRVIEQHREPQTLTYFEYTTLAAMLIFHQYQCDVCLLEVGLGGRLDATNIWDADCSIITSIALDHEDWLGSDIAVIATEKAAIGRPGRPFIIGEPEPPASLAHYVHTHRFEPVDVGALPADQLPWPSQPGAFQRRNAACAQAAVQALSSQLPVSRDAMDQGIQAAHVHGRFERRIHEGVDIIFDVAHNPASAQALTQTYQQHYGLQPCPVVFACLGDKDIPALLQALSPVAAAWYCLNLETPRAISAEQLVKAIVGESVGSMQSEPYAVVVKACHDVGYAVTEALSQAQALLWHHDPACPDSRRPRLIVTGSFHTLGAVYACVGDHAATDLFAKR